GSSGAPDREPDRLRPPRQLHDCIYSAVRLRAENVTPSGKRWRSYLTPRKPSRIQRVSSTITNAAAIAPIPIHENRRGSDCNCVASYCCESCPARLLPSASERNQMPMICPTKRGGASFVIQDRPTGERHRSPHSCST